MFESLRLILSDNWAWRKQILQLALMDIKKTYRGSALGWAWALIKPAMYISVFWFALDLGLRAGKNVGDYPYLLWLAAGVIPWFFMQSMLGAGANVCKRYGYLVNRIKFPLAVIPTFYALSALLIDLVLIGIMLVVCFITQQGVSIYLLQLPLVYLLMFVFWTAFSLMASIFSAISNDFFNMLKALSTPIFWASGVIFNISTINIHAVKVVLAFNPVTFFVSASRACFCDKYWLWERPETFLPFLGVLAFTLFVALLAFHRSRKEIADVI